MNEQQPRDLFAMDFPNIPILSFQKIGEGWDNSAFLVNNHDVFRIPKNRAAMTDARKKHIQMETALLNFMQGKLSVAIPKVTLIAPDYSYFGYKYLPGRTLFDLTASEWNEELKRQFEDKWLEIATTIPKLLPEDKARELGLEDFRSIPRYIKATEQLVETRPLPDWAEQLANRVTQRLDTLWQKALPHAIPLHGDLGLTNWLVNESLTITSLIDWSDACIAPIEFHLFYWVWEPLNTVERLTKRYAEITGYQPDIELLYLAKFANFFSDLDPTTEISEEEFAPLMKWNEQFQSYLQKDPS